MILIDPITREEILLAKALGENVPDIVPIIRKEMYLAKIAGADIQTPEAITREEMYLDAIANGTEVNIEPITRKEMFYAKALGLIESAPEPITRIENLLNQITAGGGGGSCDKYSWEGVFASIKAGTYATDYAIGDCVPLDLGSEGLINMQIAAFDTDDLADGSGKAPITWIAKELLTTLQQMNPTDTCVGGWENCNLRTYLNTTILSIMPSVVSEKIKTVIKSHNSKTANSSSANATQKTNDVIWIPSRSECIGDTSKYFGLFADIDENRKKHVIGSEEALPWWNRDASQYDPYAFAIITATGGKNTNIANTKNGCCLCFCT